MFTLGPWQVSIVIIMALAIYFRFLRRKYHWEDRRSSRDLPTRFGAASCLQCVAVVAVVFGAYVVGGAALAFL
ncbi:MAG: hypothetical protein AAF961_18270, partial [Planctomycetota bacterium]